MSSPVFDSPPGHQHQKGNYESEFYLQDEQAGQDLQSRQLEPGGDRFHHAGRGAG